MHKVQHTFCKPQKHRSLSMGLRDVDTPLSTYLIACYTWRYADRCFWMAVHLDCS